MTPAQVAHLVRRAGFGWPARQLAKSAGLTAAQIAGQLSRVDPAFEQSADKLATTILGSGNNELLSSAWTYRLLWTPSQFNEKMTLFWHGHFATSTEKVDSARMMWSQNQLLRRSALGDFREMVQAIAKDPAMLVYLDSQSNRKAHPNENFARELMELFCLGEGNYTEFDVQELARCFTGWEVRNKRFRKNRYQQDSGTKTLLGQSGAMDGEAAIDIVLAQDSAATFIAGKLFRFFVCDEPAPPAALLAPLADKLRSNAFQIRPVMMQILTSKLFFSEHAQARKIRSPVELAVGLLRCLEGSCNTQSLAQDLRSVGQGLFYPPNVKGWDGGRAWINSSTLLGRANLLHRIIFDEKTQFKGLTLSNYLAQQSAPTQSEALELFADVLLAVPLTPEKKQLLLASKTPGNTEIQRRSLLHAMVTLPEYQLG